MTDKVKVGLMEAVKWISCLIVLIFIAGQLSGGKESDTPFETMSEKVVAAADMTNMQPGDNQMIKRFYNLDPKSVEGVTMYYPTTNMGAEELLLVKLSDVSQQEMVEAAIGKRLENQKNSFEGYGIEQFAMLESSVTSVEGNYILYVVAKDPAPVVKAFKETL